MPSIKFIMKMLEESGVNTIKQFKPLPPNSGFHGSQLEEVELRIKIDITENQYNSFKSKIFADPDASVSGVDGTPLDK